MQYVPGCDGRARRLVPQPAPGEQREVDPARTAELSGEQRCPPAERLHVRMTGLTPLAFAGQDVAAGGERDDVDFVLRPGIPPRADALGLKWQRVGPPDELPGNVLEDLPHIAVEVRRHPLLPDLFRRERGRDACLDERGDEAVPEGKVW